MTADGIKRAAEAVAENGVATTAWRFFGGVALAALISLNGFTLDAVYESHAQIAAQSAQIQILSTQLDKLGNTLVTTREQRDQQMATMNDRISEADARLAVDDQSISEIRAHLGQQDIKIGAIWDDIASLRARGK